ncbi:oxidative stress-induced growth inhibitor 1-like [Nymphalis io]|uniref:oxidative stress-induced growth inhibitor 1-like n=1 Tax=Inachis io TaxID=171585 RepID=UPI00216A4A50|nr:oxidative stress-induced growth inhibitor 1-like [Nymphalis io]XP_050355856.1 oxidative stress-induced growth inhibitor 1-like [Nymphalis io]XP_050355858.1 oxidative stress-induced growth inhibitor 1-like [Nymphalis io]XP_050355859.1 oxidative stress-induced growth inhibitor 1-like [Nymphalis io]
MRDSMKSCQHTLSDDVVYKDVVVIGNGPSGMVTSFMLAGNVPYLKEIPDNLPIDEMLRARLQNLPPGQSLLETDLTELAEGLEGRSQNPIPLLVDNLLRPCADLGLQEDSLIEWRFDAEKQIEHIVLGKGPPGGAWPTFPGAVRTLSPAAWLALPPHARIGPRAASRLPARAVAAYCARYVHACRLQRYFRSGATVTHVGPAPRVAPPCRATCPRNANFCVSGYDHRQGRGFRYLCARVVLACGANDRPNSLPTPLAVSPAPTSPATLAVHSLPDVERALRRLAERAADRAHVLVLGSGVSAADAVRSARAASLHAAHVHRLPPHALARLSPHDYPDYAHVYKMMLDGPSGNHPYYTPYPDHMIVEITPIAAQESSPKLYEDKDDEILTLKRVKLLNLVTNETVELTVSLIAILIGSKPDLFFLQTNFNLNKMTSQEECIKCIEKKESDENQRQCFLRNHWHYIKSVFGQSIQICKSRYLNYSEINGNTDTKCVIPDCNRRNMKCVCNRLDIEKAVKCQCEIIPYNDSVKNKVSCQCHLTNPFSDGLGFGVDPSKPVDGRGNPIAIDKRTHEVLNAPKGLYALGPLTADNFIRFIPGGAVAIVAHLHKEIKQTTQ